MKNRNFITRILLLATVIAIGSLLVFQPNSVGKDKATKAPASVAQTAQTNSYYDFDDGYYRMGVPWPDPRFADNGDGTVTDNLTGLIWLKDANCFGLKMWDSALFYCNELADGQCGLTDGSGAGDWSLPNKRQLISLIHDGYGNLAVPDTAGTGQWSEGNPFINVQPTYYWSSTTNANNSLSAWRVRMDLGDVNSTSKTITPYYVWPVRRGH